MSKAEDVYNYRKDYRSDEEFKYAIKKTTKKENDYLLKFIEAHNKKRKKRDIVLEHWGNTGNGEIVTDLEELKFMARPDFILDRCYDNSYFVKTKQPLEVQLCKTFVDTCYIKTAKIDWPYDKFTKDVCNKDVTILFVIGTNYLGEEKYSLLRPEFLKKIKINGIEKPKFMGGKPCYHFNFSKVKWRTFNGENKQERLNCKESDAQ